MQRGVQVTQAFRNEIGKAVKTKRLTNGRTQKAFALEVGTTATTISNIERGRALVSAPLLQKVVEAVGIPFTPSSNGAGNPKAVTSPTSHDPAPKTVSAPNTQTAPPKPDKQPVKSAINLRLPYDRSFLLTTKSPRKFVLVGYQGVIRDTFKKYSPHVLMCQEKNYKKQDVLFLCRASQWDIVKTNCLSRKPVREQGLKSEPGLTKNLDIEKLITPYIAKISEDGKYRHPPPVKIVLRNGIVVTGAILAQDDWNLIVACKKDDKKAWILIFKHGILKVEPANPKPKPKRQPAPQPKKQKKKAKGKSADFTSHFTPEQMAEINASKADVQKLFIDRESLTKAEAVKLLPDYAPKLIGRVLSVLVSEGFFSMTNPEATAENPDPKVIFTRKPQ